MDYIEWSDDVQDVITGDLTAAVAYGTPAAGAVAAAVSPIGLVDRGARTVGFTTSLGLAKKLNHILQNRRLAMCYHTRTHGLSTSSSLILIQGLASVDLTPSAQRLDDLMERQTRYLGQFPGGPVWDWLLREYQRERVFVDIHVQRIMAWHDLSGVGATSIVGLSAPQPPQSQAEPANGTGPRVNVAKVGKSLEKLPHRLLAFRGSDGYPVIVPVTPTGTDRDGIRIQAPSGLLPQGVRRAGWLAHRYNAQCVGLSVQMCTGWLEVSGDTGRYAPHTVRTLTAPSNRTAQALGNGILTKYGHWQAARRGTLDTLASLATLTSDSVAGQDKTTEPPSP